MSQPEKPTFSSAEELKMEEERLIKELARVRARKLDLSPVYEPYYKELQGWFDALAKGRPEMKVYRSPSEQQGGEQLGWRRCSWNDGQMTFTMDVSWVVRESFLEQVDVRLDVGFENSTCSIQATEVDLATATSVAFERLWAIEQQALNEQRSRVSELNQICELLCENNRL